jgi:hypothetical protein
MILKRMQLTSGIKYWTSNPVWVKFQEHGSSFYVNIEEKVWLLVEKIWTWIQTWKNFAFWQKLGDFIETKAKRSPTSPGLVSPEIAQNTLAHAHKAYLIDSVFCIFVLYDWLVFNVFMYMYVKLKE